MEYNVQIKEPTVAEVYFKTSKEDLEKALEKTYHKLAKTVKVPGFRKGKAPVSIIKKHLGDSVLSDAIETLMIDSYNSILKDLKPNPISFPLFEVKKIDKEKGIEFVAEYEFFPEIELTRYKKIKVQQQELEDDPAVVEDVLKKLQKQVPIFMPKEFEDESRNIVEEEDVVLLKLEILKNHKILYAEDEFSITLQEMEKVFPGLKEIILGKKIEDSFELKLKMPRNQKFRKASNKEVIVKGTILEIRYKTYPELDDEFAKIYKKNTLEELKKEIQNNLKEQALSYIKRKTLDKIYEILIEKNPFKVPSVLLEREAKENMENLAKRFGLQTASFEEFSKIFGMSVEAFQKEIYEIAEKKIKKGVIINTIIKLENIQVSEEELLEKLKELNQKEGNIWKEEDLKNQLLKNANFRNQLEERVLIEKVEDWLLKNSEIKKGDTISLRTLYEEGQIG